MEFRHSAVLLEECIEQLRIRQDGTYVDGTLGGAGHAAQICQRLSAKGRLIGFDQDGDAIAAARDRLEKFKDRVTIVHSNFRHMTSSLRERGIRQVDGILLDLGVSSFQLDNVSRGFTYREDAPLDMRMDQSAALSAFEVVNEYAEEELFRVIKTTNITHFSYKSNCCLQTNALDLE